LPDPSDDNPASRAASSGCTLLVIRCEMRSSIGGGEGKEPSRRSATPIDLPCRAIVADDKQNQTSAEGAA
jgi:hypothetical protein